MVYDKRPVILIAYSNPVEGANLAKQVEDFFYSTYRVQVVSTKSDAIKISRSLRDSSGPNLIAALVDEQLDSGFGQDFLRDVDAVLPEDGRLLLTQQPTANHNDGIQRIALSSGGAVTFNEELQKAIEHTLYTASLPLRFTVIVKGTRKKREVIALMRFLRLNSVPYTQVECGNGDAEVVVTVHKSPKCSKDYPDPTLIQLSTELNLVRIANPTAIGGNYVCDVAVVGGGPAGLSAAVNLVALFGKKPLIIEQFAPGGAAATAINVIDNYLGFPDGIEVAELAARWKSHADKYEIDWLPGYRVTGAKKVSNLFELTLNPNNKDRGQVKSLVDETKTVIAHKVLLACGLKISKLLVTGEDEYAGRGVYYSALPGDAALYHGSSLPVAIVGGGDTAGQAAIMFARANVKTTMIIRKTLEAEMLEGNHSQIRALKDLIEVKDKTKVVCFEGESNGYLKTLTIGPEETSGLGTTLESLPVAAAYVLIGGKGLDDTTKDWVTELGATIIDKDGVKTIPLTGKPPFFNAVNKEGVFVAGDARAGSVRRIAEAVGDGGSAALGIYNSFIGVPTEGSPGKVSDAGRVVGHVRGVGHLFRILSGYWLFRGKSKVGKASQGAGFIGEKPLY
jgi:thioredoxin reductase (NADPH)